MSGGRQPQFFLWVFHYCFRTFFRCGKYLYAYSTIREESIYDYYLSSVMGEMV